MIKISVVWLVVATVIKRMYRLAVICLILWKGLSDVHLLKATSKVCDLSHARVTLRFRTRLTKSNNLDNIETDIYTKIASELPVPHSLGKYFKQLYKGPNNV